MIYGLTGGTGSGKSTVAEYLKEFGCTVVDADIIARSVTEKGSEVLKKLSDEFGQEIIDENGELIRKKLGSIVFQDSEKLEKLNEIMRSSLDEKFEKALRQASEERLYGKVFFDAPTLFESKREHFVDRIWVVIADRNTRIERIMKRDGLSREEVEKRMQNQLPDDVKAARADVVIYNDGSLEELREKVRTALK